MTADHLPTGTIHILADVDKETLPALKRKLLM